MAISISAKGKSSRDDVEHAITGQWNTNNGTMKDGRRAAVMNAINAGFAAMDVDANNLHGTTFTVAVTLTNNSFSLSIS